MHRTGRVGRMFVRRIEYGPHPIPARVSKAPLLEPSGTQRHRHLQPEKHTRSSISLSGTPKSLQDANPRPYGSYRDKIRRKSICAKRSTRQRAQQPTTAIPAHLEVHTVYHAEKHKVNASSNAIVTVFSWHYICLRHCCWRSSDIGITSSEKNSTTSRRIPPRWVSTGWPTRKSPAVSCTPAVPGASCGAAGRPP